jgi:hypothetical protein
VSFGTAAAGAAQGCARGQFGVDRVALTQALVGVGVRLVDLEHGDPLGAQRPYEPGRVGAGRLDSDALDLAVPAQPRDQPRISTRVRREGSRTERPALSVENADVVLVGVRVDTGDDSPLLIRHPVCTVPSLSGGGQAGTGGHNSDEALAPDRFL